MKANLQINGHENGLLLRRLYSTRSASRLLRGGGAAPAFAVAGSLKTAKNGKFKNFKNTGIDYAIRKLHTKFRKPRPHTSGYIVYLKNYVFFQ